jgi:hypothetical protein
MRIGWTAATDAQKFLAGSVQIEYSAPDEQPGPRSQWDWEADQIAHALSAALASSPAAPAQVIPESEKGR